MQLCPPAKDHGHSDRQPDVRPPATDGPPERPPPNRLLSQPNVVWTTPEGTRAGVGNAGDLDIDRGDRVEGADPEPVEGVGRQSGVAERAL